MKCGYPPCQEEFEPSSRNKRQKYHSRPCAAKAWKLGKSPQAPVNRVEKMKAKREERLANTTKEELERRGYARGFQAARWRYHWRQFLSALNVALSSAGPGDTR